MNDIQTMRRGQIWWVTYAGTNDPVPMLIVSCDVSNIMNSVITALPITFVRGASPFAVTCTNNSGVSCFVQCDRPRPIGFCEETTYAGVVRADILREVNNNLRTALALDCPGAVHITYEGVLHEDM